MTQKCDYCGKIEKTKPVGLGFRGCLACCDRVLNELNNMDNCPYLSWPADAARLI